MNLTEEAPMTLDSVSIRSLFQPLYSVKGKKFTAVEALSRGLTKNRGLNAGELFSIPGDDKEKLELNMRCIQSAFREFKRQGSDTDSSIFINFDSSLIDCSFTNHEEIYEMALSIGIDPSCIVIELIESRVQCMETLMDFIDFYRTKGFLIALDDVGSGYSSLDRIARIRPDIIKIDRSLVSGVSSEFYKREVCRSLVQLSHNIGALSLAEGVETLEDSLVCLEIGSDIIQGYFFAMPDSCINLTDIPEDKVASLVSFWNRAARSKNELLINNLSEIKKCAEEIEAGLLKSDLYLWNIVLSGTVEQYDQLQCAFILDEAGVQISDTCMKTGMGFKQHNLFSPARAGTDHSFKPYYSRRQDNQVLFVSDPYISRATGKVCRTVNRLFTDKNGNEYFICLDMNS